MPSKIAAAGKEVVLTYTFNNTRPIELLDLTASLLAIGDQYRRFAEDHFEGPPRNWGSSGNRGWRGYVVRWVKLLSEVETERAIVDGATNLKQEVRAAS
jgi:hypothetical protein